MSAASNSQCPVCRTAQVVCGKWTLLVIRDLAEGSSRFCELERSLTGISPRTLSLRLRALEEEAIVERHTFPEVPPRVEYALTEKGRALLPIIDGMRAYGESWLGAECAAAGDAPAVAAAYRRRSRCSAQGAEPPHRTDGVMRHRPLHTALRAYAEEASAALAADVAAGAEVPFELATE